MAFSYKNSSGGREKRNYKEMMFINLNYYFIFQWVLVDTDGICSI